MSGTAGCNSEQPHYPPQEPPPTFIQSDNYTFATNGTNSLTGPKFPDPTTEQTRNERNQKEENEVQDDENGHLIVSTGEHLGNKCMHHILRPASQNIPNELIVIRSFNNSSNFATFY